MNVQALIDECLHSYQHLYQLVQAQDAAESRNLSVIGDEESNISIELVRRLKTDIDRATSVIESIVSSRHQTPGLDAQLGTLVTLSGLIGKLAESRKQYSDMRLRCLRAEYDASVSNERVTSLLTRQAELLNELSARQGDDVRSRRLTLDMSLKGITELFRLQHDEMVHISTSLDILKTRTRIDQTVVSQMGALGKEIRHQFDEHQTVVKGVMQELEELKKSEVQAAILASDSQIQTLVSQIRELERSKEALKADQSHQLGLARTEVQIRVAEIESLATIKEALQITHSNQELEINRLRQELATVKVALQTDLDKANRNAATLLHSLTNANNTIDTLRQESARLTRAKQDAELAVSRLTEDNKVEHMRLERQIRETQTGHIRHAEMLRHELVTAQSSRDTIERESRREILDLRRQVEDLTNRIPKFEEEFVRLRDTAQISDRTWDSRLQAAELEYQRKLEELQADHAKTVDKIGSELAVSRKAHVDSSLEFSRQIEEIKLSWQASVDYGKAQLQKAKAEIEELKGTNDSGSPIRVLSSSSPLQSPYRSASVLLAGGQSSRRLAPTIIPSPLTSFPLNGGSSSSSSSLVWADENK
jgi:hypothetical protein